MGCGALARFLASRGVWLVFAELTFINFAWNLNLGPRFVPVLGVIWAIGVSMIALAGLVWLPRAAIAGVGFALVVGHNLVDAIQPAADAASAGWRLLHVPGILAVGGTPIGYVAYPLVPWIGVMALGYALGPTFLGADPGRSRRLVRAGVVVTLAFVALRLPSLYGEPNPWHAHDTLVATVIDVLDTTKYPPSLQYLCMTLGPAIALLGVLERPGDAAADALAVVGRVPFFFYVVHLYVIHVLALAVGAAQGVPVRDVAVLFVRYPPGFGVDLASVYVFWVAVVLALYPACWWFAGVKARRREWWLSYL